MIKLTLQRQLIYPKDRMLYPNHPSRPKEKESNDDFYSNELDLKSPSKVSHPV